MNTKLNPYISFKNNARQAMTFYHSVFGGELTMKTFKEFNTSQDPAEDNLIMHAMLVAPNGMTLMGADTPGRMEYRPGTNFSVSLSGDNEAELTDYFEETLRRRHGGHAPRKSHVGGFVRHVHRPVRRGLDGQYQCTQAVASRTHRHSVGAGPRPAFCLRVRILSS